MATETPEEKQSRQELSAAGGMGFAGDGPFGAIVFVGFLLVFGWLMVRRVRRWRAARK
jgi:hypothetical protein